MTPVCHLSLPLLPSVSRSLFHPSLLYGFLAVQLCGWSRRLSFALPSSCPPHFPCSVAPAVFLSLRAARLGLFLWPRFSFLLRVVFMRPVLPGLRLAPFAFMDSVASPPLYPSSAMVIYFVYSLSVYFVSLFYACLSLKSPVGLCYMDT